MKKYRSRHLFVRLLALLYAKKRITRSQFTAMWLGMDAYQDSYLDTQINKPPSPATKNAMQKSFVLLLIWSAFRLACEQPTVFLAGLVCIVPSIPITIYWMLRILGAFA